MTDKNKDQEPCAKEDFGDPLDAPKPYEMWERFPAKKKPDQDKRSNSTVPTHSKSDED